MCNFFQKSESSKYCWNLFGYPVPYPVSVWKQFLDIGILLQTRHPSGYPTGKPDSDHLWIVHAQSYIPEVVPNQECQVQLRQDSDFFFRTKIRTGCQGRGNRPPYPTAGEAPAMSRGPASVAILLLFYFFNFENYNLYFHDQMTRAAGWNRGGHQAFS